jgi:hypothetical protein
MKHQDYVEKYSGSLVDLAKDMGNMRYDSLADFLQYLADDLMKQSEADKSRGRIKLASQLEETAQELYQAREKMLSAWKTCEPYMKSKK